MKGTTMEDETTTDVPAEASGNINGIPVDDQGQALPQLAEAETTEAVEDTTEPEQEAEEAPTEPSEDDELKSWAEKKGLTLDSDNATKAAKMAREAEKAMHSKAQKASELEKSLEKTSDTYAENIANQTGQDPELLKRLQRVEVKEAVRDFWNTPLNGETPNRDLEPSMIEILQTKPHLAGDLESLYAFAAMKSGDRNAVKSQGKREALESLAHKQTAAAPRGSAVQGDNMTSAAITPQNVDRLVGENSLEWFNANKDAINKALAG